MAGFMMDPTAGLQGPYTQSNPGFMMDPVEGYGQHIMMDPVQGIHTAYGRHIMMDPVKGIHKGYGATDGVSDASADIADMESDLDQALMMAESAAMTAGAGVSSAVEESRSYAGHRKFLYMIGAPVIVYAGLTNKSNKTLGLLSALVGAYVGIKNYQDEQAEKDQVGLDGYGVPGERVIYSRGAPIIYPNCRRKPPGIQGCPPGYVQRVNNAGMPYAKIVCCKRPGLK